MNQSAPIVNARYRLLEPLGAGGMGVVYRAQDRLTGAPVALKRVLLAPQALAFHSRSGLDDTNSLLLALAQEFRLLASLRHPNIISVLDYGFDAERRPYFTMELLPTPQTLLAAGQGQPLARQIDLLVQTLQALAYLHRRGILHRDLKPANVLVSQERVRVLDFGLAVGRDQAQSGDVSGTLLYLAPEVLEGAPPSEAADLYAVGVMAYELFAGQPPFQSLDAGQLLMQILEEDPDLTPLDGLTPAGAKRTLPAILLRLLSKEPLLRYPSAEAVIVDLCAVLNQPPPPESVAIRESFLQAATFVGREQEMAHLTKALMQALQGQGSAWLIGGESGVGKSRLLEELRIQALVGGVLVLRGQGVEGGGLPYQLWREPLRRLVLSGELSDLAASVLKPIVPDIAILVARPVADAAPLHGTEHIQRLQRVVIELLQRQSEPILFLLEDLQWAEESIMLLQEAVRLLADRPVLFVATYRDDERPLLPEELSGMQHLLLPRLDATGIAQLSTAILGEIGGQPQVLALLERETEGNTFFMVEVVRALAEESGGLAQIGQVTLPAQVFTGGVQRLVQRRLQQVPTADYPLLQMAAVLGREIDQAALQQVISPTGLERWLLTCAEAHVLEVQGEQWRFVHDKLREGVLIALSLDEQPVLHHQAAQAIEQAYATNLAPQTARLTEHYHQAGDLTQERHYARLAGDYAASTFVNDEAVRHYSRALQLTEDGRDRFALLLAREKIYERRGDHEAQVAELQRLMHVADALNDNAYRCELALRQARYANATGDLAGAILQAEKALKLAQDTGNQAAEAAAHLCWGLALSLQYNFAAAHTQLTMALQLAQLAHLPGVAVDCLSNLGDIARRSYEYTRGQALFEQALQLSRELGDLPRQAEVLNGLAINASYAGDQVKGASYFEEALRLARLTGEAKGECRGLINLGAIAHYQGDYDKTATLFGQALSLARLIHHSYNENIVSINLGILAGDLGDFQSAATQLEACLHRSRNLGIGEHECLALLELSRQELECGQVERATAHANHLLRLAQERELVFDECGARIILGQIWLRQGAYAVATHAFQTALEQMTQHRELQVVMQALVGLAQTYQAQGQMTQAYEYANQTLAWLEENATGLVTGLLTSYATCYEILAAQQDERAFSVLEQGYQILQRRAATISDPNKRQSYLQNVPANRQLLAAWQKEAHQP